MSTPGDIPVIDLADYLAGKPRAAETAAQKLRTALTEIGFYYVTGHGVPAGQIQSAYEQAARFHALPLDAKMAVRIDRHNVGYLPMKGDTLRTSVVQTVTKPNLNEAFFVARDMADDHPEVVADRRFRSANRWPKDLPGFRETVAAYCDTMERLVQKLMPLYARALGAGVLGRHAIIGEPTDLLPVRKHKGIIIGRGGSRLKEVGSRARSEINALLGRKVHLDLRVKVAKEWQRDPKQLGRLGF